VTYPLQGALRGIEGGLHECKYKSHRMVKSRQLTARTSNEKDISFVAHQAFEVAQRMTSPMMATSAAAIMKGALALHLLETHTVVHIDKLASALGGTVILKVIGIASVG